jgi:hypothetical protein
MAMGTFSASQRTKWGRGTAGLGDKLQLLGASTERKRRSEPGKEERKEGEWCGVARGPLGDPSRRQEAGGGEQEVASWSPGSLHTGALVTQRRRQAHLANSPLVLGSFLENFKIALVLYHLML